MKHDIQLTALELDGIIEVAGACSCGWSGGSIRPSRPDRIDEMKAQVLANHDAWRATDQVQEFEAEFDKLDEKDKARIEKAMKREAPSVFRAAFGAKERAAIEDLVTAEGLPSLWTNAKAAEDEEAGALPITLGSK
jgi:hypothetical protein